MDIRLPKTVRSRFSKPFVVVGLVAICTTALAAQGPFAPSMGAVDLILAKLDAIASAVNSLAPTTPEPGHVTLYTSAASVAAADIKSCSVSNVGPRTLTNVRTNTVFSDGSIESTGTDLSLEPGHSFATGVGGTSARVRCVIQFDGGFPSDVRASMTVESGGFTKLVLEAR